LYRACIDGHRVQLIDSLSTELVSPYATENSGAITKAACHDSEVCRSASKVSDQRAFDRNAASAVTRGQNVPQQFTHAEDQMLLFHRAPLV
jgi:hypothetical protein